MWNRVNRLKPNTGAHPGIPRAGKGGCAHPGRYSPIWADRDVLPGRAGVLVKKIPKNGSNFPQIVCKSVFLQDFCLKMAVKPAHFGNFCMKFSVKPGSLPIIRAEHPCDFWGGVPTPGRSF